MRRALILATATVAACASSPGSSSRQLPSQARATEDADASARAPSDAGLDLSALRDGAPTLGDRDATLDARAVDDPMAIQRDTKDGLLLLFPKLDAPLVASIFFGPAGMNQGNKAVAHHATAQRACLKGLRDIVLQTPEQRALCGADNMVPVWDKGGDASSAKYCIDIFEFPNKTCELPIVWTSPSEAEKVCEAEGKRLCDQDEWNLACRADPAGGADRTYAYGNELDVTVCNTNKSRVTQTPRCDVSSFPSMWQTCTTDTEPSGSFPKCRSRFGVFDQHGNVAEIMTRFGWDEPVYSKQARYTQLKGSAWFYVDVEKKPWEPGGYWERYPDHCNFDPRWHVEEIAQAAHVNYHLGFRCCKPLGAANASDGGAGDRGAGDGG